MSKNLIPFVADNRNFSAFVYNKQVDGNQDFEITLANEGLRELLLSETTFEKLGIPFSIRLAMANINLLRPSKIQATTLPLLTSYPTKNLIAQAQTGTGKTAAFLLNILRRIDVRKKTPQALVLSPTRELARQIILMANDISLFGIGDTDDCVDSIPKTQLAIPGEIESAARVDNAQIIVGTPGTVLNWIRKKLVSVKDMRILVVDEADNMLDGQGLGEQCIRVKQTLPESIQICLFSATFPDRVRGYAFSFAPPGNTIFLRREELTVHNIRQILIDVKNEQAKFDALVNMYHILTIGASIIFCKTRVAADLIKVKMEAGGHKVGVLHAGLETATQRDKILDDFRCGRTKVMITTNVLARGFDMSTVSLVINYDLPRLQTGDTDYDTYLHRVGRTGRFGRAGVAISFVHDTPSWMDAQGIEKQFGVPLHWVPGDDIDTLEKAVNLVIDANKAKGRGDQEKHKHEMNTSMNQSRHAPS